MAKKDDLFYDRQLSNKNLTWRLLAPKTSVNSNGDTVTQDGAGSSEVARGIILDSEFSVAIGHSYNDGMNDPLGGSIKKVFNIGKSMAPYMNTAMTDIATGLDGVDNIIQAAQSGLQSADDWLAGKVGISPLNAMNGSFLSAFDLIKSYTGTEVTVSVPKLDTLWMHEEGNNILSRIKQVQEFCLGDVQQLAGIYGLQYAPNNYKPNFRNLNATTEFPGTFTLEIGTQFKITNLVLKSFNYNLATIKAKELGGGTPKYPLYATVSFDLEPAAYITKERLANILNI